MTFFYTGWFMGILPMTSCNPYLTLYYVYVVFHPENSNFTRVNWTLLNHPTDTTSFRLFSQTCRKLLGFSLGEKGVEKTTAMREFAWKKLGKNRTLVALKVNTDKIKVKWSEAPFRIMVHHCSKSGSFLMFGDEFFSHS